MSYWQRRAELLAAVVNRHTWPLLLALCAGGATANDAMFSSPIDVRNPLLLADAATTEVHFGQTQPIHLCSQVYSPNTNYDPHSLDSFNVLTPQHWAVYSILKLQRDPSTGNPSKASMDKHRTLLNGARLTVITPPAHGKLLPVFVEDSTGSSSGYFYMANAGYFGRDRIRFKITYGDGTTLSVIQDLNVIDVPTTDAAYVPCATKPSEYRKLREQDFEEIKRQWKELKWP